MFPWWYKIFGIDLIIGSKMNEIDSLKNLLEYNHHLVEEKDKEIQRLTNLMLTEHGLIRVQNTNFDPSVKQQPINKRASWPQVQKDLERADQAVAKRQVNDLAEYWQKKDQEALSEL